MQSSASAEISHGFFFFFSSKILLKYEHFVHETVNYTYLSTGITSELHFLLVFNLKNIFAELNLDISIQMELNSMSILTDKADRLLVALF